ncbi:MAG: phage holin family protein [Coriobacteriia bacterium]|nr:phage holin family protein [Coriobacteriia bacterium]MBN2822208.1 phage holin family protein [Coriobacteriia bacterium]
MADPDTAPEAPKTGIEGIIDAVADLLQTASDWVRQEAETVVREKVVKPIQRLGLTLVSASAAGCLLVVGLIFIAVGLFVLLGEWITYPGALLAIGGVYVLVSLVFIVIKVRMMQK